MIQGKAVAKQPYPVEDDSDIVKCQEGIYENIVVPIFKVSSVTGEGVPQITRFIYGLQSRIALNPAIKKVDDPVEFFVQDKFTVTGIG